MTAPRRLALAGLLLLAAAPALAQDPPPPKEDPAATDAAVLEALVKKAMPIVEKIRGGTFKTTPPVQAVTREQFVDRYSKDLTRVLGGDARVEATSRLLARFGILEEGADLRALLGSYLKGNIAANYDPETKKVSFLPGVPRTVQLMVHELTHALDDQLFDMTEKVAAFDGSFDRALAYGALAEGDAQSVEYRYFTGGAIAAQALPQLRATADQVADAVLKQQFGGTPPALVLAFKSQYTEGLIFAEAVRRSEGRNAAMDAAFRNPPASTEQILHPEKYLAGKDPPAVLVLPAPPEGAKKAMSTTMGELGTRIVLLASGMDAPTASDAAAGWGGDTAALVAFPAGEALVWTTVWDTEADAVAFAKALNACFPVKTGEESSKRTRLIVRRGEFVDYVEAPLDAVEPALQMIRKAERK
jgi:hypothetical protein